MPALVSPIPFPLSNPAVPITKAPKVPRSAYAVNLEESRREPGVEPAVELAGVK